MDSKHHYVKVSQDNLMENILEMEATCAICLDIYSHPIYLSCAHILCFDCGKKWMTKKEDLIMTCPVCRKEQKRPVKYDGVMKELAILLKQHGPLLKQHKGQITGLLRLVSENTALAAKTGDSSREPSNDLKGGKPGHNLVEDPRRFISSAHVVDNSHFFSVCHWEVDVEKRNEWAPGICKEPVSRRNIYLLREHKFQLLGEKTREIRVNFISERHHRSPGLYHVGIFLALTMEETKFVMGKATTLPMSIIISAFLELIPLF